MRCAFSPSQCPFLLLFWANSCGRTGGIVLVGGNGKIDLNNTFDARLELLQDSAAPAVRQSLFGKNPNRKFHD